MKNDPLSELLSSYLDGESRDPEAVERLLEKDPAVRRRYDVLRSQSQALRRLPMQEVAPEFSAGIVVRLREQQLKPHRGRSARAAPWTLVAAVALVLAAVYQAIQTPPKSRVPSMALPSMAKESQIWREVNPDVLDSILLERIASDPDALDALESVYSRIFPDAEDLYRSNDVPLSLHEDLSLDIWIENLNPGEEAVFRELLLAYAMED
ncbi:MAG: anti-sigma factor family protein [Candidatus Hydrogenedentales bacterium]